MLKLFIPIFWTVFFGAFVVAAFVTNSIEAPQIANYSFRLKSSIFVIVGVLFFALTFMRLKRVDSDDTSIYVSNYFKTFKYPLDTIESITIYNHIILKAAHLKFNGKSSFGKKIIFIPFMINLKSFAKEHKIAIRNYGDK
jgi:hypothetical protein